MEHKELKETVEKLKEVYKLSNKYMIHIMTKRFELESSIKFWSKIPFCSSIVKNKIQKRDELIELLKCLRFAETSARVIIEDEAVKTKLNG